MIIDTDALATSLLEQLTPTINASIAAAVATTTRDYYHRETASQLSTEIQASVKRMVRAAINRLEADPTLYEELTAACRAGLLEGARRGAEEAGVKVGAGAAKAAVQVEQLRLVERAR